MIQRLIAEGILQDLTKKIVILSGPRQTGKTTLSRALSTSYDYLNYDNDEDRIVILKKQWDRSKSLIILDEIHKNKKWKSLIKGVFDKEGIRPQILITGSARLNAFKKFGDSLAGRHFSYRLYPFDLKELTQQKIKLSREEILHRLMNVGGFPEPFLEGKPGFYNKWKRSHHDLILRQDMLDFENVRDVKSIETLIILLAEKVGTSVSYQSFANELGKDPKTIQRWLEILENLYVIFRLTPYHKDISRSIKKEPKFYFFDTGVVKGEAAKFENLVALSLLKETHFLQDVKGINCQLHYVKVKGGREIDFYVHFENQKSWLIEAKLSESDISSRFKLFAPLLNKPHQIQLVLNLKRNYSTESGIFVQAAPAWLAKLDLEATR